MESTTVQYGGDFATWSLLAGWTLRDNMQWWELFVGLSVTRSNRYFQELKRGRWAQSARYGSVEYVSHCTEVNFTCGWKYNLENMGHLKGNALVDRASTGWSRIFSHVLAWHVWYRVLPVPPHLRSRWPGRKFVAQFSSSSTFVLVDFNDVRKVWKRCAFKFGLSRTSFSASH